MEVECLSSEFHSLACSYSCSKIYQYTVSLFLQLLEDEKFISVIH